MPDSIKETQQLADQLYHEGKLIAHRYKTDDTSLYYIALEDNLKPALVFIHGTPGSWRMFARQFNDEKLASSAYMVAIDRPGWGGSAHPEQELNTSFEDQAQKIAPLLRKLKQQNNRDVILVGHSLGATLAPYVAAVYPELVDATVAIAGDLTNDYLAKQWYNELGTWSVVRFFLSTDMLNANEEVLALPSNLDLLQSKWRELVTPFWIVQGGKDSLVDPRNAKFAEQLQTKGPVNVAFYPESNHLIHLNNSDVVNQLLLDVVLRNIEQQKSLSAR